MLHKTGDFIFRASVISNSCGWQKVAEMAHFTTVARLICRAAFRGMAWINFLRARYTRWASSNLIGAIRQGQFSSSGPSPHQRLAAGQLDALDRALAVATIGLLIAVTLSTR
jgi:hypothetical protein